MYNSNIANYVQNNIGDENIQNPHYPDNITDLDLQNQLVDSIQDDSEDIDRNEMESNSMLNQSQNREDFDLSMSNQKLSDVYNRQKRLDQDTQKVKDFNQRLVKIKSNNYLQENLFQMIQPLISWLEYSIRTRDKIHLFKKIW